MSKSGFIYLIGDFEKGYCKIGVTTGAIEKRMKKLQTGNAGELYLLDYFFSICPFFVEKWLHKIYVKYRQVGEWFDLPIQERTNFKSTCQKYEDIYKVNEENKPNLKDVSF